MSKINNTIMHLNTEEINRKNQIVDNTIIALKKEFIGIDNKLTKLWIMYVLGMYIHNCKFALL